METRKWLQSTLILSASVLLLLHKFTVHYARYEANLPQLEKRSKQDRNFCSLKDIWLPKNLPWTPERIFLRSEAVGLQRQQQKQPPESQCKYWVLPYFLPSCPNGAYLRILNTWMKEKKNAWQQGPIKTECWLSSYRLMSHPTQSPGTISSHSTLIKHSSGINWTEGANQRQVFLALFGWESQITHPPMFPCYPSKPKGRQTWTYWSLKEGT